MSFDVSADAYMRFMGQYSERLAAQFADLAGIRRGQRVLDVGCGPDGPALLDTLVAMSVGAPSFPGVPPRCTRQPPGTRPRSAR